MSSDARRWTLTATLVLLTAGLAGLAGCASAFGSGPAHSVRQTQRYSRAITRIDLQVGAGSITLSPGKGKRTTVTRRLEWSRKRPGVTQSWTGTTLHIAATCPDQGQCAVNYTITLPVAVAVQAHTGAGNVTISRLASDISVTDNAGNVRLAGVSGAVRVTSQAGNVTGIRLRSGSASVRGQAGKISLRFTVVPGTVSAITAAGPVLLTVPSAGDAGYHVAAHTNAGQRHVSVHLNSRSRHSLVARTNAGNVTVR
jgi:hypothetical protein